ERGVGAQFRARAGVCIGVLPMLLVIASLSGERATTEIVNSNIQASDIWAFYQAKNIRQTANQLAAEQLELALVSQPGLSPAARAAFQKRIAGYRKEVQRFENEPDPADP